MILTLIAAIGKNNELGKGNDLVWKMPEDQKHFRERTTGHTMIMGRKTFESLGRVLPNRRHIVITRDENYKHEGVEVAHSLAEAVALVQSDPGEVFIIGGAEIFKQAMDIADKLDITHIDGDEKAADVFFPEIIPVVWNETSHAEHQADKENPLNYTFSVYERFA